MVQVVERSIQLHLREGASSNVLCFGYGQVSSTHCLLRFLSPKVSSFRVKFE